MTVRDRIEIVKGDITQQAVDAIVNAANTSLLGGGGVDGAIHRAAGPELVKECMQIGGCPTGEARITGGYNLPARHIIHTVGPIWRGGDEGEAAMLANCYRNTFALAVEHGVETIAFPSISTGAYRFPVEQAARIAITETRRFLEQNQSIQKVIFVSFDDKTFEAYEQVIEEIL